MNNKFFTTLLLITLLSLSVWGRTIKKCVPKKPHTPSVTSKNAVSAQMIVQGYEWGPAIPKIIVEFEDNVTGFDKNTFAVKTDSAERQIINAYNSNEFGDKQEGPSKYLALELVVKTSINPFLGVSMGDASPFVYDFETGRNSWATSFNLDLDLVENKTFKVGKYVYGKGNDFKTFTYNLAENYVCPETQPWDKDSFTADNITLQRASFTPEGAESDSGKNPLVIWLHGAGEGGRDLDITLLGNEVIALADEGIQKYFKKDGLSGAYVLAVQTPTMWMDRGDGTYNDGVSGEKQKSKYTKALIAAIEDYVANNDDIDTDRIYLGGCSNGGYMTMNLMFEHKGFYTAFYPICEAYMDRNISEEMIEEVKDYNIWFLQSEDDTTVNPLQTAMPTFYRLLNAGAKNVHFTLKEKVVGTDDPDAIYMGHYSWVYAFNDQVKEQFDNAKALKDFPNVTIEEGTLTSKDNYVTSANCNEGGNMWSWLAAQRK